MSLRQSILGLLSQRAGNVPTHHVAAHVGATVRDTFRELSQLEGEGAVKRSLAASTVSNVRWGIVQDAGSAQ